ncbi:hypothetical protein B0H63DRAFT_527099 [Podospora didyma]|uniref:Uncharacterized protein n=1 Tax=Podospora didyma TaxID=330526 RepID=A0AAE0K980_9PEZI|nr:hypothetical protein B0H63DRAFT_527099 [Podospora didyma]
MKVKLEVTLEDMSLPLSPRHDLEILFKSFAAASWEDGVTLNHPTENESRQAWMDRCRGYFPLQELCTDDLCTARFMLRLIHDRAHHRPDEFWKMDQKAVYLGIAIRMIPRRFLPLHVPCVGVDTWCIERITSKSDLYSAYERGDCIPVSEALVALFRQAMITTFVNNLVQQLLKSYKLEKVPEDSKFVSAAACSQFIKRLEIIPEGLTKIECAMRALYALPSRTSIKELRERCSGELSPEEKKKKILARIVFRALEEDKYVEFMVDLSYFYKLMFTDLNDCALFASSPQAWHLFEPVSPLMSKGSRKLMKGLAITSSKNKIIKIFNDVFLNGAAIGYMGAENTLQSLGELIDKDREHDIFGFSSDFSKRESEHECRVINRLEKDSRRRQRLVVTTRMLERPAKILALPFPDTTYATTGKLASLWKLLREEPDSTGNVHPAEYKVYAPASASEDLVLPTRVVNPVLDTVKDGENARFTRAKAIRRALKDLGFLLSADKGTEKRDQLEWKAFVQAMFQLGFQVTTSGAGSKWRLRPREDCVFTIAHRAIMVDRPHGGRGDARPAVISRDIGRRIKKHYGLEYEVI